MLVERPDGEPVEVGVGEEHRVFDAAGEELGSALQLVNEALNLDWVGMNFLLEAYNNPEPEELTGFVCSLRLDGRGYHLHWIATDELHRILELLIGGEFQYIEDPLELTLSRLGGKPYASGEGNLFGRDTIWVVTTHDKGADGRSSRGARRMTSPFSSIHRRLHRE